MIKYFHPAQIAIAHTRCQTRDTESHHQAQVDPESPRAFGFDVLVKRLHRKTKIGALPEPLSVGDACVQIVNTECSKWLQRGLCARLKSADRVDRQAERQASLFVAGGPAAVSLVNPLQGSLVHQDKIFAIQDRHPGRIPIGCGLIPGDGRVGLSHTRRAGANAFAQEDKARFPDARVGPNRTCQYQSRCQAKQVVSQLSLLNVQKSPHRLIHKE